MNPQTICDHLDTVTDITSFAVRETLSLHPLVQLQDFGVLPLPAIASTLAALAKRAVGVPHTDTADVAAEPPTAPNLQLPAQRITLPDSLAVAVQTLCVTLAGRLNIPHPIFADLVKLIVVGPGQDPPLHRDDPPDDSLFGSLLLTLPSDFGGGQLTVSHAGEELTFDLSASPGTVRCTAFYNDCEVAFAPITHGSYVALVFDLTCDEAQVSPPTPATDIIEALSRELETWHSTDSPVLSIYALEQAYSRDELSLPSLKELDLARATILVSACRRAGIEVSLTQLTCEKVWTSSRELPPDHHDLARIISPTGTCRDGQPLYDWSFALTEVRWWRSAQDLPIDRTDMAVSEKYIWPADFIGLRAPDQQLLRDRLEGNRFALSHQYQRAALVMWPKERTRKTLGRTCMQLVVNEAASWSNAELAHAAKTAGSDWYDPSVSRARLLAMLQQRQMVTEGRRLLTDAEKLEPQLVPALLWLIDALPTDQALALATEMLQRIHRDSFDLQCCVASELLDSSHPPLTWRPIADSLLWPLQRSLYSHPVNALACIRVAWATEHLDFQEYLIACLNDPHALALLVDATLELDLDGTCPEPWRAAVCAVLEHHADNPPQYPKNQNRTPYRMCPCHTCLPIRNFLGYHDTYYLKIPLKKNRLRHVLGQLFEHQVDVIVMVDRTTNPHTLVLEKNTDTYELIVANQEDYSDALVALRMPTAASQAA